MIDIDVINDLFSKAIRQRGIAKLLGKSYAAVRVIRWRQKVKNNVTLETKLQVLQKAGIQLQTYKYKQEDLVDLINYYQRCSMAARELGPEYIIEKWIARDRDLAGVKKL